MATTTIILACILMPVLLYYESKEIPKGILPVKTAISLLFVIAALVQPKPVPSYFAWLLPGLIFCLGGDVFLSWRLQAGGEAQRLWILETKATENQGLIFLFTNAANFLAWSRKPDMVMASSCPMSAAPPNALGPLTLTLKSLPLLDVK
jgi:hypothetical protein